MTLKEKIQAIQDKKKYEIETRDFYIGRLEKELKNIGLVITKKDVDGFVQLQAFCFSKDKRLVQSLNFGFGNHSVTCFLGMQKSTHRYDEGDFNLMMDVLANHYAGIVSFEQ